MKRLNVLDLLDATQTFEQKFNLALIYSGLRLPQYRVMDFLEKSGKITVSDLSRQYNVSRATISVLVNELIRVGIVTRIKNRTDKRSFYIKLSDSGLQRLETARQEINIVEDKISQTLPDELVNLLNNFSSGIRQ
ncbi:MAG: MarR family winged helix-turn-helix transcriptional regulator [Thiohalomonadales bacterium]